MTEKMIGYRYVIAKAVLLLFVLFAGAYCHCEIMEVDAKNPDIAQLCRDVRAVTDGYPSIVCYSTCFIGSSLYSQSQPIRRPIASNPTCKQLRQVAMRYGSGDTCNSFACTEDVNAIFSVIGDLAAYPDPFQDPSACGETTSGESSAITEPTPGESTISDETAGLSATGEYTRTNCTCNANKCSIACSPLPSDCRIGFQFPDQVHANQDRSSLDFFHFDIPGQINSTGGVHLSFNEGNGFQCAGQLSTMENGNRQIYLWCVHDDVFCRVEYQASPAGSRPMLSPSPSLSTGPIGGVVGGVPPELVESTEAFITGYASSFSAYGDISVTCYNQIVSVYHIICSTRIDEQGHFNCSFDESQYPDLIPFCRFRAFDANNKLAINFLSSALSTTETNYISLIPGASVFGLVQYRKHNEVFHPTGGSVTCYQKDVWGVPQICQTRIMDTGYFQCFYDATKFTIPKVFCDFEQEEIVPYRSENLSVAVDANNVIMVYPNRTNDCKNYNGCGPATATTGLTSMVPETYLTMACNNHDCCYSDCHETKATCDTEMEEIAKSICRRTSLWSHQTATSIAEVTRLAADITLRYSGLYISLVPLVWLLTVGCNPLPEVYYLAVSKLGDEAWRTAQLYCSESKPE